MSAYADHEIGGADSRVPNTLGYVLCIYLFKAAHVKPIYGLPSIRRWHHM